MWKELRNPCQKQGFSQGNQDCQLDAIYEAIGTTNKYYVEYGFNTRQQCSGSGPNSCKLWKIHGWKGLLLDGNNENPEINLHAHYLFASNIVDILKQYDVPEEPDLLSGDMDSHDYFVMESILTAFKPRVVTTEYNMNWPGGYNIAQLDPMMTDPTLENYEYKFKNCVWGASAPALKILMERSGYVLIGVTPNLDLFWGRSDVFHCYDIPPFDQYLSLMRLGSLLHPQQQDLSFLDNLVDTKVWEETKNVTMAKASAVKMLKENMKSNHVLPCLSVVASM